MAFICPRCGTAHDPRIDCEEAKERREEFQREVEHHKFHNPDCPNPEQHVRDLRRRRRQFPESIVE